VKRHGIPRIYATPEPSPLASMRNHCAMRQRTHPPLAQWPHCPFPRLPQTLNASLSAPPAVVRAGSFPRAVITIGAVLRGGKIALLLGHPWISTHVPPSLPCPRWRPRHEWPERRRGGGWRRGGRWYGRLSVGATGSRGVSKLPPQYYFWLCGGRLLTHCML